MKLIKETIKESIEQYKAPNTESNKSISLIESDMPEEKEDKEEVKLPDAKLEEPIVVSTEPEAQPDAKWAEAEPAAEDAEADPELSEDEKENIKTSVYSLINSMLQEKFKEIDSIKSIIATVGFDGFKFEDKADVITILNSVLDDCNIHVGMYQKALGIIDPEAQAAVDQGKDKAEDILADSDLAEKEPEPEEEEKEEDEDKDKEKDKKEE